MNPEPETTVRDVLKAALVIVCAIVTFVLLAVLLPGCGPVGADGERYIDWSSNVNQYDLEATEEVRAVRELLPDAAACLAPIMVDVSPDDVEAECGQPACTYPPVFPCTLGCIVPGVYGERSAAVWNSHTFWMSPQTNRFTRFLTLLIIQGMVEQCPTLDVPVGLIDEVQETLEDMNHG